MLGLLALLVLQPVSYALDPVDLVWEAKPTGEDLGRMTPPDTRRPTELRVTMFCTVGQDRRLQDCFVPKDAEGDYRVTGMLRAAKFFKVAPLTRSGLPTVGRTVRVPLRFTVGED